MGAFFPRIAIYLSIGTVLSAAAANAADAYLPLPNGGFESGFSQWTVSAADSGISSIATDQAASGAQSLKITDNLDTKGSSAQSQKITISGAGMYELRGRIYPVSGTGLGMYVRVYNAAGAQIEQYQKGLGGADNAWTSFTVPVYTTRDDAASLDLWVHSYMAAIVTAYLDDLYFVQRDPTGIVPRWEGTYKIKPGETEKLTEADVVGPDGIVYPNWTMCGVQGGIPSIPFFANLADYGGYADDSADDSAALDAACAAAGVAGGGAVQLDEGAYYLDWPVTIRHSNVVIRGKGMDKTRIIFRYAIPPSGVSFYQLQPNHHVGTATPIQVHFAPLNLRRMEMKIDSVVVRSWDWDPSYDAHDFYLSTNGSALKNAGMSNGTHTLTGTAVYADGTTKTDSIPLNLDWTFSDTRLVPDIRAAVCFTAAGPTGSKILLTQNAARGTRFLSVTNASSFAPRDRILIEAPATERWNALTTNQCPHGYYRRYLLEIEAINGNQIEVTQPVRIEYPTIDGSYVQKLRTIEKCGLEDLYIEQTEDLWITTAMFSNGWNCWARNVKVYKCGRNPVYGSMAKWCEIRDCVFDDAWWKGGGGTAYAGWENSSDCLAENLETWNLRHAPLFQWAGAGNVIRKSVFHNSDAQWHSGWTNENLMELCAITANKGNGAYGYGMWASPPEDVKHGPNGPRNVVYNCDVSAPLDGLWMGGMNENWLIVYNRFASDTGAGVIGKDASFDHIVRGNVFILKDGVSPMAKMQTPDCIGWELIDNKLYGGNGSFWTGIFVAPEAISGNEAFPLDTNAPRPQPAIPSIYEWQNRWANLPPAAAAMWEMY